MSTKDKRKGNGSVLGENLVYDFVKITGIPGAWIAMRPRVIRVGDHGLPRGGYMLSANHCSFWDPILLHSVMWKRRMYSLVTKDLYKNRLMTWFLNRIHCIQVDKENFSLDSFHQVNKQLKRGKVVLIFPEGQVHMEAKDMSAFKTGIILMAHRARVPIVPTYIVPVKHFYNQQTVLIGDPIDIRETCGLMPTVDDLERVGDHLWQQQERLKNYYYHELCPQKAGQNQEMTQ